MGRFLVALLTITFLMVPSVSAEWSLKMASGGKFNMGDVEFNQSITIIEGDFTNDANCMCALYMNGTASGTETDRSINSADFANNNSVGTSATVPSGYSGASRDFVAAEDDYLTSSATSLRIAGADQPISISLWFRLDDKSATRTLYTKGDRVLSAEEFAVVIAYDSSADAITFQLGNAGGTGLASQLTTCTGGSSLSINTWYHLACVYNDTDMRIYIDGVLDSNGADNPKAYTAGIYSEVRPAYIGILYYSGVANEMDGLIDEVIVFDRELSSTEVLGLKNNGISGNKGGND